MFEREEQNDCSSVRDVCDQATEGRADFVARHLERCETCLQWHEFCRELCWLASNLPHFDVPASVSQKIMSRVTAARSAQRKNTLLQGIFFLVVGLVCLLILAIVETPGGVCSWLIGFMVLVTFKAIDDSMIKEPSWSG